MLCCRVTTHTLLIVLTSTVWLVLPVPVCAQEIDEAKALKVRAAYLYNFAKFIEWPGDAFTEEDSPFVIGVVGDDVFAEILRKIVRTKKITNRAIVVQKLRWGNEEDRVRLERCHILCVGNSVQGRLEDIFSVLKGRSILLVSDIPGFARDGGMIGFVLEKQRIIFEINREALDQANLKASAKLLKLARIVG